ncbi:MAG: SCO family protein [Flavobacteriales bacterium]|nr:SCO family protein [Flavobacteriales bacterium]
MKKVLLFALFFIIGVSVTFYLQQPKIKKLPVINPVDLEPEMVDSEVLMERKGFGHTIGDFEFTNQNGEIFSQNDLDNCVYVAEYFFTTCGSICPIMNKQMQRVHEKYKSQLDFRILSFTVDPEVDNVERMKAYAEGHNAGSQWQFLTGKKEDLYNLARKSFFVLKPAEAENLGDAGSDFIHTNNFVLVDRKSRIRGYYDGTKATSVDSLMVDIGRLLKERE